MTDDQILILALLSAVLIFLSIASFGWLLISLDTFIHKYDVNGQRNTLADNVTMSIFGIVIIIFWVLFLGYTPFIDLLRAI